MPCTNSLGHSGRRCTSAVVDLLGRLIFDVLTSHAPPDALTAPRLRRARRKFRSQAIKSFFSDQNSHGHSARRVLPALQTERKCDSGWKQAKYLSLCSLLDERLKTRRAPSAAT
ncbi:hypothetical protein EVAR_94831_1 [Eumeta japonica]|uniref:Uncharacterized protein n=1 Tax=Eumeta variegata TaxID=151549 RepID=A0A4C1UH88_EUMVA|nr:hypothetical protein EVAR_94831_1 [Eumeta japonica]